MKYKHIIKLRHPETQLLAVVPMQLKFRKVKDHDELTILLFETLFCMWECFNMGTELPTEVTLGKTLVLRQYKSEIQLLPSSMQTTVFKSPINGTSLLSFIQHC
jgi:hypothetical protein